MSSELAVEVPKIEASVEIKVPFYDVDSMAITWHGNYIKYFEIARCALLDLLEYDYISMTESNYAWPVIEVKARYIRPTRFGQEIALKATLTEYQNRLKINYLGTDKETGDRIIKGHTIQVAVDMETGEMQLASPQVLCDRIEGYK